MIDVCGISHPFGQLSPARGQVTHVLLSRPPLSPPRKTRTVRLACFRHAASVYPEPGSNSPSELSEVHPPLQDKWLPQTISQQIVTLPTTLRLSTCPARPQPGALTNVLARKDILSSRASSCQDLFQPETLPQDISTGPHPA